MELVVVDDGSTNGTSDLLRAWRERVPTLKVISLSNGGSPSLARNEGLRAARGELVLFCDADDVVEPGWIAALASALETHDLVGGPLAFSALNPVWPERVTSRSIDDALPLSADHLPFAHTGNLGVRRAAAHALGGFDESMVTSEDQDFSWRAIRAGLAIGFVPDAVVQVRLQRSLSQLWRQRVLWGVGSVDLYMRHSQHMPPPRSVPGVAREILRLAGLIPFALVSRSTRLHFVESVAFFVGRARGSLKNRKLYL